MKVAIKENKWLVLILVCATIFLFLNLGNSHLTIDEANTGYLSKNVLKYGYPRIYDEKNMMPIFNENSINKMSAWIEQPWLQYYITAASLKIFGVNSFGARFPFSLFGLISILVVYFLALELTDSKRAALLSSFLMTVSVPFMLYARNCRYYSLVFLFGPLCAMEFLKWIRTSQLKYLLWYGVAAVLLFYSFYPMSACIILSTAVYEFGVHRKQVGRYLATHVGIGLCCIPWLVIGGIGTPAGSGVSIKFMLQEGFFLYIWKLHVYMFPFVALVVIWLICKLFCRIGILEQKEVCVRWNKKYLMYSGVLCYFVIICFVPMIVSQYLVGIMPFIYILFAVMLLKLSEYGKWLFISMLLLGSLTNVLNISPFIVAKALTKDTKAISWFMKNPQSIVLFGTTPSLDYYLNEYLEVRFYLFDFLYEITHDYDTRMEGIVDYLKENGSPSDTVLSWWGETNVLLFHTNMKIVYHPFPMAQNREQIKKMVDYSGQIDWVACDGIFKQKDMSQTKLDPMFGDIDTQNHFNVNLNRDYDKILIPYPKMYFDPPPNIEFHNFRTDTNAPDFYIYKRK